jgi:uncharacterized protein (DUF433 family)
MTKNDSMNVVAAFSEDDVVRLTGVSHQQLRYWDQTNFFKPSFGSDNRRVAYSRIYSFRDIVALRTLHVLRNQYSVPLQHLRKVAVSLSHLSDEKWTATELFVLNKKVIFAEPGTAKHREIVSGQYVIGIPLKMVVSDTRKAVESLFKRGRSEIGKFERNRNVSHNSLVIAGTRIPVSTVKEFAAAGYSVSQILKEYPTLNRKDVEAALALKDERNAA